MGFGDEISIIIGRVTEIGVSHIVVAPGTRVVLPQGVAGLTVGMSVTVRAVRSRGQYVAETVTPEPT